ncbi:unnamed protein product [Schistosoma margrebowiei]|uniref:Uncharacterized protein n=1 Tax=Schistosoma margrebowiei TaxID=48269 RepID=A0A183MAG6_9TREM|nr:unnamed protein product [Schistosoma margrebowiei]
MEAGNQRFVHMPFVPAGYWSPCAPLIWNPVKVPDIRFSSSRFRKQHPHHEKAVSRTSLAMAIYTWPCESISRGRANSPLSTVPGHLGANVIVSDIVYPNDSYISDEMSHKSDENLLNKSNYDRKFDTVLIDTGFSKRSIILQ